MLSTFLSLSLPLRILIVLQCVGTGFLIYEAVHFSRARESSLQSHSQLVCIFSAFFLAGYIMELLAPSAASALNSAKIEFIGHPLAMFFLFRLVSSYCHMTPSRGLRFVLMTISICACVFMLSSDINTLMLRSFRFVTEGVPHLQISFGPVYYAYIALNAFYFAASVSMVVFQYLKGRKKGFKDRRLTLVGVMGSLPSAAFLLRTVGAFGGYDLSSLSLVTGVVLLNILFIRYHIFDSQSVALDLAINDSDRGIILADDRGELAFANRQARVILNTLPVMRDTIGCLLEYANERKELFCGTEVYSVVASPITDRYGVCGSSIVLRNITGYYQYTNSLLNDVEKQAAMVRHIQTRAVLSLAGIVEARDDLTGAHVRKTADYVRLIAEELRKEGIYTDKLTDENVDILISAAPLHDIGKLAIPDSILKKPGALTPQETEVMRTHTTIGASLIEQSLAGIESAEFVAVARDIALCHHEKWDGSGYPAQLSGTQIPLCARIMSVADVYDALTSDRCYRPAMSREQALDIMLEGSGSFFDPAVLNAFLVCSDAPFSLAAEETTL